MGSDDEDELAQLRAARNARLGLSAQPQRRKPPEPADDSRFFEPEPAQPSRPRAVGRLADSDSDEDAPAVVDFDETAVGPDDELRTHFPMAFGEQEKAQQRLEAVHAAAERKRNQGTAARSDALDGQPALPLGLNADGQAVEQESDDEVGPPRPPAGEASASENEDDDDDGDPYLLPITHEVSLQSHGKLVTAIALDRNGARALTGSEDYQLQMFDFGGMKRDMRSFRKLEPMEGYPINALSFSPSGDAFLVVSGSSQPKIYDRDGHELGEFVKGDPYIRDMTHTKGHQYRCCSGQWHPVDRYTAITSSEDGTVRVWDTENIKQKTVLKPTLRKAGRFAITACAYNSDGTQIAAGLNNGSVQLWDVRGKVGRSAAVGQVPLPKAQMVAKQDWSYVSGARHFVHNAHEEGDDVTCVRFSADSNTLLSRSADETLKVWDARRLKTALAVFSDLPAATQAGCCFSPDESLIVTGTASTPTAKDSGALMLFDRQRLELVRRVNMGSSVSAILWHERLNQIFVGTGDRKGGCVKVLYHPSYSEKGVLLSAARVPRAVNPLDFEAPLIIKNPHALPMYREENQPTGGGRKRKAELEKMKALKTKKPDLGAARAGQLGSGGRIGATGGSLLTQYILKQQGMMQAPQEEDIRATFLRHEGVKDDEVSRLTSAYEATQPKKIFAEDEPEEEDKN